MRQLRFNRTRPPPRYRHDWPSQHEGQGTSSCRQKSASGCDLLDILAHPIMEPRHPFVHVICHDCTYSRRGSETHSSFSKNGRIDVNYTCSFPSFNILGIILRHAHESFSLFLLAKRVFALQVPERRGTFIREGPWRLRLILDASYLETVCDFGPSTLPPSLFLPPVCDSWARGDILGDTPVTENQFTESATAAEGRDRDRGFLN